MPKPKPSANPVPTLADAPSILADARREIRRGLKLLATVGMTGEYVAVYVGGHMACLELPLTLNGSGIPADVETLPADEFGVDARVCIDPSTFERAAPIVEDFTNRQ